MKAMRWSTRDAGRLLRQAVSILLAIVFLSGCAVISTLRIEQAKNLGAAGQQAAVTIAANVMLSDAVCQQALEVQTLLLYHEAGEAASEELEQQFAALSSSYQAIQAELQARRQVFAQLGETYMAFAELAGNASAAEMETAIRKLGEAVNKYAETAGKDQPLSSSLQRDLSTTGLLLLTELQKRRLKQASTLIRERLTAFAKLLNDPLVKEQMLGFQEHLAAVKQDGVWTLWDAGVLDPSPLLNEIGADIGLRAAPDAAVVARQNENLRQGLDKIIAARFARKINLIRTNYEASVKAMEELIREHEALEKDRPLNLALLISITTEQQRQALALSNKEAAQ